MNLAQSKKRRQGVSVASIAPAPIKDAAEQNGNAQPSNNNLMPKRQSSSQNHRKA